MFQTRSGIWNLVGQIVTHTHIETDQVSHATPKKVYRFLPSDKLAGAWRKILHEPVTGIKKV
jgi:hypothetical protein